MDAFEALQAPQVSAPAPAARLGFQVQFGTRPGYNVDPLYVWWQPFGLVVPERADALAIAAIVLRIPGVLAVRIDEVEKP